MKPESSLRCPQQPTSYLYPEPDESNPHSPTISFKPQFDTRELESRFKNSPISSDFPTMNFHSISYRTHTICPTPLALLN
jgi:hypothetical protein